MFRYADFQPPRRQLVRQGFGSTKRAFLQDVFLSVEAADYTGADSPWATCTVGNRKKHVAVSHVHTGHCGD